MRFRTAHERRGHTSRKELVLLLTLHGYHVAEVLLHHNASVKDLHKLWLKHPQRVSLLDLAKRASTMHQRASAAASHSMASSVTSDTPSHSRYDTHY